MDVYTDILIKMSEFMKYLENSLKKLHKEDKEIYLCGDFNIDLLKLETINVYQEYYNLLCSYGFLPHIIQPTRIVENQIPSVIDNIFSNNICEEITALSCFLNTSHNLSQLKKRNWTLKNRTFMFGIIQNFHQKVFGRMVPYKTLTIDIIQLMTNLRFFLEIRWMCGQTCSCQKT